MTYEEGHRHFAEPLVGDADDGRVAHAGRGLQYLLDVRGEHLVATTVDDIADAALDPDEAIAVDACEIAGAEIPADVHPVVERAAPHITGGHSRRAHGQLADLAGGHGAPVVADDLDLHAGVRSAGRAELLGMGAGVGARPADHLA